MAVSAEGKFQYPTGKNGALALNYDQIIVENSPAELLASFCSVGNPFSIDAIPPGSQVLDIGCGGGFDMIVAGRLVGEKGRVCGIDLTEEMVNRARKNMELANIRNFELHHVDTDNIPYPDQTFDVAISNGVINLSPRKKQLFTEIRRVLKPGGRLQFADIILKKELPDSLAASPEAWSQ
ncbi:MAG: methyltransferase domain-containing protein [Proteobacteria bacterium]|nr:methyltransferase domain-containing protein [Pseudomonadota bacterium]MBU1736919.1 methyltransferase domain-containing protein [Pseudomonadota bacterium]